MKGKSMKHTKAHPGFQAVAAKVAKKEGVSKQAADAIIAAGARNASAHAKRMNSHLKRVLHRTTKGRGY
jgi:hypothetical protein